jgi:hypothetical protein
VSQKESVKNREGSQKIRTQARTRKEKVKRGGFEDHLISEFSFRDQMVQERRWRKGEGLIKMR